MVKRRRRSEAHLSKDSKVEVCSNEEGYRGARFPAKILDPQAQPSDPSTKKKMKKAHSGLRRWPKQATYWARSRALHPPSASSYRQSWPALWACRRRRRLLHWCLVGHGCNEVWGWQVDGGFLKPTWSAWVKALWAASHWDFLNGKWLRPRKKVHGLSFVYLWIFFGSWPLVFMI